MYNSYALGVHSHVESFLGGGRQNPPKIDKLKKDKKSSN